MLEFALGVLVSWWALGALCIFAVISERMDTNWSVFWTLCAGVVAFMLFSIPVMTMVWYALGYLVIGVVWSFWRYRRYVVQVFKDSPVSDYDAKRCQPSAMVGSITAWIIVWPFSMIENLSSDIITFIENLVKGALKAVYQKIYDSAVKERKNG